MVGDLDNKSFLYEFGLRQTANGFFVISNFFEV